MPRKYVPKHKSYSDSKLQEAIDKVRKGDLSYREAETKYKIDKSLLWRKIHNLNTNKQGRKTVLSIEAEADLADKIKIMAKWGWALTRTEIKSIVHTYVVQNNIKNTFKNNYPGKDWIQSFFGRHKLVAKKMEQLEKSRRQATSDPFIIYHFYDILEKTVNSLGLLNKPHQIWNLDETSFSADPTRIKGVTGKGQKAHRIIQGSGKENTTVMGCISAGGTLLPPLIIFKGQNLWSSWKGTNDIPGTTYACSENGWMMTSIFNEWFANFCKTVKERPLLVIFDGHITHLDPVTIELALQENVSLLKLPAHTTDVLQPMDRSCFGPIKYKWNEHLIEWQRLNQRSLTKSEFCNILGEVWRVGLSENVIQNSFKVTGIYPVNKDVYPKDRLDPVKLARFNQMQLFGETIPDPLNIFEDSPFENIERVSPSGNIEGLSLSENLVRVSSYENINRVTPSILETGSPITTLQVLENVPPVILDPVDPYKNPEPSCSFETLLLSKIKHTKALTGKRRKIDGKGKLLTSEDYLKSIENLDKPKEKKKTKKKDEPKKKMKQTQNTLKHQESDTDTDIEDEVIPYQDESDLENISLSEILALDHHEESYDEPMEIVSNVNLSNETNGVTGQQNDAPDVFGQPELNVSASSKTHEDTLVKDTDNAEYVVGNFVLVCHAMKKGKKHYVAQIEALEDKHLTVVYLKRSKKIFFVYPDVHISYSIQTEEVVMKLPSPSENRRGGLIFDIDYEKYHIHY